MSDIKENTKKNDTIGILVSVGFHSLLLIVLLFVIAWRQPDPPLSGPGGVEINIGFDDAGMGDVNSNTEPIVEETPAEEILPDIQPEDIVQDVATTDNMESPHIVEKIEKKETPKKETAEKKEDRKPVEAKNLFPNKGESDGNKNKKGNQGDPQGNPDSRNLYPGNGSNGTGGNGNGGGGNGNGTGASLDLPGWQWDTKPNKIDPTSESGYVLFEFYVDEDGTVTSAKKIDGANLTPSEDNFYKKQLLETSFSLKDSKAKPAPKTRGVFRFDVKSR